jgi:predicted membrane protein (TIGR00267 family)
MMDFELRLEAPSLSRAWISAAVMGLSYFIGGLIPMIPYFAFHDVLYALYTSIGVSVVILLIFGYIKAIVTGTKKREACLSAVQTLIVGAIAAGTAYGIVRGVNQSLGGVQVDTPAST